MEDPAHNAVYKYDFETNGWTDADGSGTRIACGPDGPVVINALGDVYHGNNENNGWEHIGSLGVDGPEENDIGCGPFGTVFALGERG